MKNCWKGCFRRSKLQNFLRLPTMVADRIFRHIPTGRPEFEMTTKKRNYLITMTAEIQNVISIVEDPQSAFEERLHTHLKIFWGDCSYFTSKRNKCYIIFTKKKLYAPFLWMGFNCLKPLQGGSLLFTIKFPGVPGTQLINLR